MKRLAATIAALFVATSMSAQAEEKLMPKSNALPMSAPDDVRLVTPGLQKYREGAIADLWKRRELAVRDRSIITLAALVARNQTIEMPYYLDLALDNGVKPSEISEIITHLAFYSGLSNAMSAVAVAKDVFAQRKIGADQLPAAAPPLLPLDEPGEADRAARVGQEFGTVAPGLVQYTTDVLFRDLWLRPGLAPRDRSLVTVAALIAAGNGSPKLTIEFRFARTPLNEVVNLMSDLNKLLSVGRVWCRPDPTSLCPFISRQPRLCAAG